MCNITPFPFYTSRVTFGATLKTKKTRKSLFINELRYNFVVTPGSFWFYLILHFFM